MRLTIFIIAISLIQVSAKTNAQISLDKKNTALKEVLKSISVQSGYDFLYNDQTLKDAKPVSIHVDNVNLETALKQCFEGQPLSYSIEDKTVVIKEKEKPSFLEKAKAVILNSFQGIIDISGKILDENNKPLPGASVKVKKTGKAVSTDKDGKFFLRGVEEGAVLVVSFIGYLPKEVNASANMGNVVLEPSLSKLDGWVYCGGTTGAAALPGQYSRKYGKAVQRRRTYVNGLSAD